jgi:hypothetical protein
VGCHTQFAEKRRCPGCKQEFKTLTLKAMHRCASTTVTVPAPPKPAANPKTRSSSAAVDQRAAAASLKRPRSAGPSNGAPGAAPRATSKGPARRQPTAEKGNTRSVQLPHRQPLPARGGRRPPRSATTSSRRTSTSRRRPSPTSSNCQWGIRKSEAGSARRCGRWETP